MVSRIFCHTEANRQIGDRIDELRKISRTLNTAAISGPTSTLENR